MAIQDYIEVLKATVWPLVASGALIYIWRSDAIGKLLRISDAVDGLKEKLSDLVEVEERLRKSTEAIGEFTGAIGQIQSDLISMKSDVESVRDRVDQLIEATQSSTHVLKPDTKDLRALFGEMDTSWQRLTDRLQEKFGWFDRRMTGGEAYRFAHGNRKGNRLSYEQADEIGRLHSAIKSYRRRQSSLEDWLDEDVRNEFVQSCTNMATEIDGIE